MDKKITKKGDTELPKKLVYRNQVYRLARTREDGIWEEVSDYAEALSKIAADDTLNPDQRKLRANDAFSSLRGVMKDVFPF